MFRKSAVAAALLFISASPDTYALGLGEIDMQSALNQPMSAVISLTSAAGTDLSKVKVSLASREAHQRAGLSRARILSDFRFKVETGSNGQPVIHITSYDAIHEPFLEFLLQLEWSNGRLLRQYTVLVDPPVTIPAAVPTPAAPVARAPAPVTYEAPAPAATRPVTTAPARSVTVPAASPAASSYGPIRRSDTLWSIAKQLRPDESITMEQMMLALQRANPNAFMNDNINHMKAGVTLKVPDRSDIVALSAREARAEARRQYTEWKAARDGVPQALPEPEVETVADAGAEESVTADSAEPDTVTEAPVTTEARLQLMAPEDIAVEGTATAGDPGTAAATSDDAGTLSQQLALVSEEAEANRAQADELQSRVEELEQQIVTMKRLLELKNDELASMQQQAMSEPATEIEAAPIAEPVAEATPEPAAASPAEAEATSEASRGIVNRLMDNPLLAGLGVLVAMVLGGILWASTRQKNNHGLFDEEMTFDDQLARAGDTEPETPAPVVADTEVYESPVPEPAPPARQPATAGDPLTEADVYLAYGRIQQAEDVLQTALQNTPNDRLLRGKLLEVYHQAGNAAAFASLAGEYRDSVTEDDSEWPRIAAMGRELSPDNELFHVAGQGQSEGEFDIDMSGMEDLLEDSGLETGDTGMEDLLEETEMEGQPENTEQVEREAGLDALLEDTGLVTSDADMDALLRETGLVEGEPDSEASPEDAGEIENALPETIEFNLDDTEALSLESGDQEEEDEAEGLLDSADEVTTKLDLARAYIDMGDPDGARSILSEVMEEGSDEQKREADTIISQLA